jgi:diguanylate cyclase (GGDEF)-like protein
MVRERQGLTVLASAGLFAVLVLSATASLWTARTMEGAGGRVDRATQLISAYDRASDGAAAELAVARSYTGWGSAGAERALRRARRAVAQGVAVAARTGAPPSTLRLMRRDNVRLVAAVRAEIHGGGAASLDRATRLEAGQHQHLMSAKGREAKAFRSSLDGLGQAGRYSRIATLIVLLIGAFLVALMTGIVRRWRRRVEASTQDELERLERAALTDNLTGLGNHRAFQEDLETALLVRRHPDHNPLSLVLLDLDGLKETNDVLGHQAGDERIVALAQAMRETLGAARLYRLGGDEFAAILDGEAAWSALRLAQSTRSLLATRGDLSAAAGVAEAVAGLDREQLHRRADVALIRAKRSQSQALVYAADLEPAALPAAPITETEHLQMVTTALARAVDAKDSSTRSHCQTVSELCAIIGAGLGLAPERIDRLRLAGLLHDVGKIGIADAILQKPEPLSADEFEVMMTHTTLGFSIVQGAGLEEEATWILHHHERVDGMGYPDGLAGDKIPLESRIILCADAFEAMTSDRPYRQAGGEAEAIAELERHIDTQFDPLCVAALRRALQRGAATPLAA